MREAGTNNEEYRGYTLVSDLASFAEAPEASILSRTIYKDARMKAVLFSFAPGMLLLLLPKV